MLIIWGSRRSYKHIGAIASGCPNCGTQMGLFWAVKKFTLYWIPLFPMDKNYAMGCHRCKTFYMLNQAAGAHMHSQIMSGTIGDISVSSNAGIAPPNAALPPLYPPTSGYPTAIPPPMPTATAMVPDVPPLPCRQCGTPLEKGAQTCGYCGATVA